MPLANALMKKFAHVVLTQDWHPPGHASFASTHGAEPFSTKRLDYGDQTLWPDHCVQGTHGAALHPALDTDTPFLILRKGMHRHVDSYSAFVEADGTTTTGLAALLHARGVKRVFCCGLATDFCVAFSALDARTAGFEAYVIEDACRAIDAIGSLDAAWARMDRRRSPAGPLAGDFGVGDAWRGFCAGQLYRVTIQAHCVSSNLLSRIAAADRRGVKVTP